MAIETCNFTIIVLIQKEHFPQESNKRAHLVVDRLNVATGLAQYQGFNQYSDSPLCWAQDWRTLANQTLEHCRSDEKIHNVSPQQDFPACQPGDKSTWQHYVGDGGPQRITLLPASVPCLGTPNLGKWMCSSSGIPALRIL